MGLFNFIYIQAKKILDGVVKIVDKAKKALQHYFENAHNFLKKAFIKVSQRKGNEYKGATHFIQNKGNQFYEGTDIISVDKEMGEYSRTTVLKRIEEEEVPTQYRDMKNEEELYDTEDVDAVLSFES